MKSGGPNLNCFIITRLPRMLLILQTRQSNPPFYTCCRATPAQSSTTSVGTLRSLLEALQMFQPGVSLVVAATPESLPIFVTIRPHSPVCAAVMYGLKQWLVTAQSCGCRSWTGVKRVPRGFQRHRRPFGLIAQSICSSHQTCKSAYFPRSRRTSTSRTCYHEW